MAKLFYGMNQSLDGYVDHTRMKPPGPKLFEHFIEQTSGLAGSIYGRTLYELMHYWDDEQAEWSEAEMRFAKAWRSVPKFVVSGSLTQVGPNAQLLEGDLADNVRRLKAEMTGELEVGGPALARSLTDIGLIDEYRIYLHPEILGDGTPYFGAARAPLRLHSFEQMDENVIRLSYVPE
jgi:dihydrofolate reductase